MPSLTLPESPDSTYTSDRHRELQSMVRQQFELLGREFKPTRWKIACAEGSSREIVRAFLTLNGLPFQEVERVKASELHLLPPRSIGESEHGQLWQKSTESLDPGQPELLLNWVFIVETGPVQRVSESSRLSMPEFWKMLLSASWFRQPLREVIDGMKPLILGSLLINLTGLMPAMFAILVYDRVIPNQAYESLFMLIAGVVMALGVEHLLKRTRHQLTELTAATADSRCVKKLADSLLLTNPLKSSPGTLLQHLRSLETLRELITGTGLLALIDLPFIAIYLLVLGLIHPAFALAGLVIFAAGAANLLLVHRKLSKLGHESHEKTRNHHALWLDTVNNLTLLQASGLKDIWTKQLQTNAMKQRLAGNRLREALFESGLSSHMIQQIGWLSIIALGAWLTIEQSLTVGGIFAASMLGMRCFTPLQRLQSHLTQAHAAQAGFAELNSFLNESSSEQASLSSITQVHSVELTNFSLKHGERSILDNINLRASKGEKIAIIGPSGSGKTTLLRALGGQLQPNSGTLRVNDYEFGFLDPVEFASQMALTEQPPALLEGTLFENLALGRDWIHRDYCLRALTQAGAIRWVEQSGAGLELPVGQFGRNLSSGQKQQVSLARAWLTSPSLILLDEPSNGLDQAAEQTLLARLMAPAPDEILFFTTHRLSLLQCADRLIYLEGGRIVADGNRADVLKAVKDLNRQGQS